MIDSILEILFEEDYTKTVAIYGGGFKPPTKGHFNVVEKTLQELPDIDEAIIFVGGGVRDGITQEESLTIWNIYKKYLSDKVTIEPSVAPVKSILNYAKEHPEEKVYWILGAREGNEEDLTDIANRTRSIEKYPNIEVKVITSLGGVSGTKTRKALLDNNKEQFLNFIPDIEEKEEIWNILSPKVQESLEEGFIENAQENMKKLLLAIKQEGRETRDAFKLVLKAAKGEIQLTDEQKKQIGDQLKDVLKMVGLVSIAVLPGSFIVGALIKIFKAERLVFPSSLMNEDKPSGDSNPLGLKYIDTWHEGQYKAEENKTEEAIKLMIQAAKEAEELESIGEANYYKGTIAWLKKDYNTVNKYINDKFVKSTGNDEVLKRLLNNKDKSYKEAYNTSMNEVGEASAKVYPFSSDKDPSEIINLAKNFFSKGTSSKVYQRVLTYTFPTDKANYVVKFNVEVERQTYVNFSKNPDWKPGPPYKTYASVGFNIEGEEEDKDTNLNEQFSVLSTVTKIIFDFIDKINEAEGNLVSLVIAPKSDTGEESSLDSKRGRFYTAYIQKNLSKYPEYKTRDGKSNSGGEYVEIYKTNSVNELEEGRKKKPDPKKGTGKKPEGSGRRLYTDEDPKDTVSIKFKTKEDIVDTLNKASFKAKSHARQSQVINLIHQRVRAAYGKAKDPEVKSRLKRALDYIESRKEASKEKTERLRKMKEASDPQAGTALPYGSGFAPVKEANELNVQDLAYKQIPGLLEKGINYGLAHFRGFMKSSYKWSGPKDRNDFFDFIENIKGEIKRVPLSSIKPSQSGKDYKNSSSEYEAEEFQKILDGEKNIEDHRKEDFYPILVNKRDNKILDGNHRHYALSAINSPYAVVLYVDVPKQYINEKSDPFGLNEFAKDFVNEVDEVNLKSAEQKIDNLPQGKLFDDAKNIESIFNKSHHSWSETIESFETNKDKGEEQNIDIKDIHITQPNIQSNKVKNMIMNIDKLPIIDVVEFPDGEKVIYDGHHRLVANWALGNTKIKVNLIKVDKLKENDPFGLNKFAKDFVKEVFEETWNPKDSFVSLSVFMKDNGMNITPLPKIKVISDDKENASHLLGKTAYYNPADKSITLYTFGRHPKDVLRSFAHEMVHHEQNLNGTLGNVSTTNTNEDGHLDKLEREAYEKGNIMFRNWEDSIKNNVNESFIDIPKFNYPKTLEENLWHTLNEITLNPNNAVEIYGDLTNGKFQVGDIIYVYDIKQVKNPYDDGGDFYNIMFHPEGNITSIPQQGKENYIKILNTMYKIILDFTEEAEPEYVGIASLDNDGSKNYHTVYANLTNNKSNIIPGYFRKDVSLGFNNPQGKGRFVVLKRKDV